MRRLSRVVLWGGLLLGLSPGVAPAQSVNEILLGAIRNVPTDLFDCGLGNAPCGLTYRIYSAVDPSEINGPANPVDGIPRYRSLVTPKGYATDAQSTANFPVSGNAGFGMDWYIAWDGLTGGGTTAHAGWYAGQSQKVFFAEQGNPFSVNCLPVTQQAACFQALSSGEPGASGNVNDTTRADSSAISHVGGISPIPCPTVVANKLDSIEIAWEQANDFTSRDGASNPIAGTRLYAALNPVTEQTDGSLASGAVAVADFGRTTTSVDLSRSDPAIAGGTGFSFANKIRYAAGLESTQFSCNSALTATCFNDPLGDAPSSVDIERICAEVRTDAFGTEYVVLTYDIVGSPSGTAAQDRIQFTAQMEHNGVVARVDARALNATQSARGGAPVVMRFSGSNFDPPLLASLSTVDDTYGRIGFVIDANALADKLGASTFNLSARVKLAGAGEDTQTLSFSF